MKTFFCILSKLILQLLFHFILYFLIFRLAYEKLKDNKQALESYKKAFQLEPDNENYKTMYLDATKRLEPKEHESASSSSAPTAFNMFLGSNMASLPFGQGLDSLVASVFGVDRSW